jgi:uncharacterized protein YabE (DUF348 family)
MQKKFLRRKRQLEIAHKKRVRQLRIVGRHPFAVPVATFLLLILVGVGGYFAVQATRSDKESRGDTRVVIISYDKQKLVVPTKPQPVGELLKKLDITIHAGDVVEPELSTNIVQDNFRINIYRAKPVQVITDGGNPEFSFSAATTPRSIAAQAGVTVYPEDAVKAVPVTNFLKQGSVGEQVVITRSRPVNLNLYGAAAPTRTLAKTVGGLLKEKQIRLINGATVTPAADAPITKNMQVFVLAKGVKIVTKKETVAMPEQTVKDSNLTLGSRALRQRGSPGKQLVTYQITVDPKTKKVLKREVIQKVVTVAPVKQITVVGTNVNIPRDKISIMRAAGISSSDYGYVDYIVSHEGGWNGTTKYNYSGSGAYGICQALPGSKMASAGSDWRTNPVTQLRWCDGYATGRYGSWSGAYSFWLRSGYW